MHLFILLTVIAAALHIASALPSSAPFPFFSFISLPKCAKNCANLHEAAIHCLPPAVPVSNTATYVACFCQSQWLHGAIDNSGICPQECSQKDEVSIRNTYDALCGLPGPSATLFLSIPAPTSSPTSTPTPTLSTPTFLPTSAPSFAPTQTTTPAAEQPQGQPENHESWTHKHRIPIIVAVVVSGIILIILAWLIWCRHVQTRVTAPERDPSHEELLLARHQEYFDKLQRKKPILIVDNSRRARAWRWLKREKICPAEGQEVIELREMNTALREGRGIEYNLKKNKFKIDHGSRIKNRRPRFTHDDWIRVNEHLPHPPSRHRLRGHHTISRPTSLRSGASSDGQRSVYSPLSSEYQGIGPQLPIRPSTAQALQSPRTPVIEPPSTYRSPLTSLQSPALPLFTPPGSHSRR